MKQFKSLPEFSFFLCLLMYEDSAFARKYKCIHNIARASGLEFLINFVGGITTPIEAAGISEFQCAGLCDNAGNYCHSYAYDSARELCFIKNITTRLTGHICGRPIDEARYQYTTLGSTYVAYGGSNKTLMECMAGSIVSGNWPLHSLSSYNCIDLCHHGQYPCYFFIGISLACQSCSNTTSTSCDDPYMSTSTGRAVCSSIY